MDHRVHQQSCSTSSPVSTEMGVLRPTQPPTLSWVENEYQSRVRGNRRSDVIPEVRHTHVTQYTTPTLPWS